MWHTIPRDADWAELDPLWAITAAPRFWIRGMNSCCKNCSSRSSVTLLVEPFFFTSALEQSGNWVVEWFPQIIMLLTSPAETPVLGNVSFQKRYKVIKEKPLSNLRDGSILVQSSQRGKVLSWNRRGIMSGNQTISICRVTNYKHLRKVSIVILGDSKRRLKRKKIEREEKKKKEVP